MHAVVPPTGMRPVLPPGRDPAAALAAAHTELQRVLLSHLVEAGSSIIPIPVPVLLGQALSRFPEAIRAEAHAVLTPVNVERALHELTSLVGPHALHVDRGELLAVNVAALGEFQGRLLSATAARAPEALAAGDAANAAATAARKRANAAAAEGGVSGGICEVLDLVDKKSTKQQEKQEQAEALLELCARPLPLPTRRQLPPAPPRPAPPQPAPLGRRGSAPDDLCVGRTTSR